VLEVLQAHVEDLWGIALVTTGVLGILALYVGALGPAGHAVRQALGVCLGVGRYLLPPALIAGGIALFTGRPWVESSDHETGRTLLGLVLALAAVGGLAELAGGSPSFKATSSSLAASGGLLGAAVGRPLEEGLGAAGAVVVLVAAMALAVVLFTGVGVRDGLRAVAGALLGVGRAVRRNEEGPGADTAGTAVNAGISPSDEAPGAPQTEVGLGESDEESDARADADSRAAEEAGGGSRDGEAGDRAGEDEPGLRPGAEDARRDQSVAPVVGALAATGVRDSPGGQLELDLGLPAGEWRLPPAKLLARSKAQQLDHSETAASGRALVAALATHGVETRLVGHTVGPTVTRFELELGPGVKVARVTSLAKDIAYAMASPDVRILAPIPGRSAIGVEVPNRRRQLVTLGDVLASSEARAAHEPLEVALGRDIAGRTVIVNLSEMPHLLISGATGAGKSSCINSLITSVLMRATPEEVRMILVDPKRVELGQYNGLPHLLTQVVVDPKKAANALAWAVTEMERRYDLLAEVGMRDIDGYNGSIARGEIGRSSAGTLNDSPTSEPSEARIDPEGKVPEDLADGADEPGPAIAPADESLPSPADGEAARRARERVEAMRSDMNGELVHRRLPYVLVVVDELNDLMMVAARDVEESVCRIAQMARAVGIHLVLATQRPSVDVITGLIKANIPSRLAFSVSSLADSRVILDQPGAERLIGKGDMLLLGASSSVPRRIQGPWVTESEVRAVVGHWRRQRPPEYVEGVEGSSDAGGGGQLGDDEDDELLGAAMELVVRSQLGSTSMLQRKLRVGFSRAGRLMDLLERRGVVGPSEGSKARAVLMTPEELDQISAR
jgi:DNA segregation ATPase FtsK/SpoIIIE, S-DNA-T family